MSWTRLLRKLVLVWGLLLLTGTATAQSTAISGIHVVGEPVLVFDHLVDKREPNHIPDLPATAWKEADGTVNVTVSHFEWSPCVAPTVLAEE